MSAPYPAGNPARDRWILERRPERVREDALRASGAFVDEEPAGDGHTVAVATLLLTNRECPWRCLMCDLWKHTLEESAPTGAIAVQIRTALATLPPARWIKLYNAGSFFDPGAIPPEDHASIASLVASFERVIVESHPALVGPRVLRFRDLLAGALEVAMGLETVHPDVLPRLNKRMTLEQFRSAAADLSEAGVALRVFALAGLPWVTAAEARDWARKSVEFAFDCGAAVVSVIPTRGGNGAMEALRDAGDFEPASLGLLEACLEDGLRLRRGRVLADLWDLEARSACSACFPARRERLARMNRTQSILPAVSCGACEAR